MKQYALAATAFAGTLAVLLVVFLVVEQLGASTAVADASPSPSASNLALASRTPASVRPSSSVPASTEPSATPGPTPTKSNATPRPTATPGKTIAPGTTFDVVVLGSRYVSPIVPSNGKITKLANGGIQMESDRTLSDPTEVTYKLPADQVPPGTRITHLDVAVCGSGAGDFWETYGPADATPAEHEVAQPDADGCWHYRGGAGKDTSVHAIIQNASRLRIDKVVYTITTG